MSRSRHALAPKLHVIAIASLALLIGCKGGDAAKPDTKSDAVKADDSKKAAAPAAKKETGPVATVNGNAIARTDFDEMYDKMTRVYTKRSQPVPENVSRRHKKNILKRLIEKALLQLTDDCADEVSNAPPSPP